MKHALMTVALCTLMLCSSCAPAAAPAPPAAGTSTSGAAATHAMPADAKAVASINALCPMMGEDVTAEGGSVQFAGQTVGFCCPKCSGKFAALDDAGKLNALAKHGTTLPK